VCSAPGASRRSDPAPVAENPAGIPADYKLLYSQEFTSAEALKDFVFTDAAAWKLADGDKPALELAQQSKYKPPFRSPVNIALLKGKAFGDFIMEADCLQTGQGIRAPRHGVLLRIPIAREVLLHSHRHGSGRSRAQLLHRE
jgi:hypothetical protein